MKIILRMFCFLSVPFLLASAFGQSMPGADLIVLNAKVWTSDKNHPTAQAVAVLGDRRVAVGSNSQIEVWRADKTRVIDAEGKLLLPGFNDSHVHFVSGGLQLDNVQLNDAKTPDEFAAELASRRRRLQRANGSREATGTRLSGHQLNFQPKS